MTQHEQVIAMFEENKGKFTLGDIMKTSLAAEYRARISELRDKGWDIKCIKGKPASENTYYLLGTPNNAYKGVLGALPQKSSYNTLAPEIASKIALYSEIMGNYPVGHPERAKIQAQIDKIIDKELK